MPVTTHGSKAGKRPRRWMQATVALAALAVGSLLAAPSEAQDLRKVTFGLSVATLNASYCNFPVAMAMGYFAEEGLDVSINQAGGSMTVVQGLLSGSMDVGGPIPEPIMKVQSEGHPMVMAYNYVRRSAASVAVPDDSPIQKLEDLRGKKLGVQTLGSGNILLTNSIVRKLGVDPDKELSYLAVGIGAQALQALRSGHVDGFAMFDSLYAQMEAQGAKFRYLVGEDQHKLFSTQLAYRKDFIEENPEVVAGFGRAIAKSTLFAEHNPEACVRMMWQVYPNTRTAGLSEEEQLRNDLLVIQKRLQFMTPDDPNDPNGYGIYNKEDVEALNAFLAEGGIIEKPFDDVTALYTNDFVEEYNKFDREAVIRQAKEWKP